MLQPRLLGNFLAKFSFKLKELFGNVAGTNAANTANYADVAEIAGAANGAYKDYKAKIFWYLAKLRFKLRELFGNAARTNAANMANSASSAKWLVLPMLPIRNIQPNFLAFGKI